MFKDNPWPVTWGFKLVKSLNTPIVTESFVAALELVTISPFRKSANEQRAADQFLKRKLDPYTSNRTA